MNQLLDKINAMSVTESDLTVSIMRRIANKMKLTNPDLVDDLYERVHFFTGDYDPNHGFGSSDFWVVYRAFEQSYLKSLQPGDEVIETGESAMTGKTGVVYISQAPGPTHNTLCVRWEDNMGTAVTHGTRRIGDIECLQEK